MTIEPKIKQEHHKYIRYFESDNGRNLRQLDKDLVLHRLHRVLFPWQTNSKGWDIICLNENDGAIVIIEIKSPLEEATCETFGQILGYMIEAETIDCSDGDHLKTVRGIILAYNIHYNLKNLVHRYKDSVPIYLKKYHAPLDDKNKELIIQDL